MVLPRRPDRSDPSPTLFFDIDGTLLRTFSGRLALNEAFREHWAINGAFDEVDFAGNTDPQILREVLDRHGIEPAQWQTRRESFFHSYYQKLRRRVVIDAFPLPGIPELLRLLHRRPLRLGIITGNNFQGARIKLGSLNLESYFEGGGFGEDGPERERIVEQALRRFNVDPGRSVLIGDSVHDIRSGSEHGLWTVAVSTGSTSAEDLKGEDPDLHLPRLAPSRPLLDFLSRRGLLNPSPNHS